MSHSKESILEFPHTTESSEITPGPIENTVVVFQVVTEYEGGRRGVLRMLADSPPPKEFSPDKL